MDPVHARGVKRIMQSASSGTSECHGRIRSRLTSRSERKKSHDKVYPKGYVEMLEQQQGQLVIGLQEMYRKLLDAQAWTGPPLPEPSGHPLTHDILAALNLLESKPDGSGEAEGFEEDCQKMQSTLLAHGSGFAQRRGSYSSDSDHSQHDSVRPTPNPALAVPRPSNFADNFNFGSASPSPLTQSPVARQRQSVQSVEPSPLQQTSPLSNDPQFYQAEWSIPDMSSPGQILRSRYALQAPTIQDDVSPFREAVENGRFDSPTWNNLDYGMTTSYPQQAPNAYSENVPGSMQELVYLDAMDLEFNNYISVNT